jgi:ABC-type sugar transport system permease subunit
VAQLFDTFVGVVVAVGAILGLFVGVNLLVDQAPRRFRLFATVAGAAVGAFVGALANSGGWFLGGGLWPLGGAVVGALLGGLVWGSRPPSAARRRRIPERLRPAIFLAPALLFLGVTLVVPTIRTVYLSLRGRRSEELVGFDNYRSVFGDDGIWNVDGFGDVLTSRLFIAGVIVAAVGLLLSVGRNLAARRGADLTGPGAVGSITVAVALVLLAMLGSLRAVLWNNLYWIVFVAGLSTAVGLAIAVLADRARGESVAKSLIFMPMAISFVGASVIWRFVYAFTPAGRDQIGLLNAVWVGFGGDPQAWIQQQPWNTLFLIAIMIWIQTGFAMVVLSAAIKAVPDELREAARVDGASEGQTFWRVVVPQIRPTIGVVVITLVITTLKVYDIVKVMTNGEFGTNVIANQMFDEAFINRDIGRGSTLAVLIFIGVLPLMIYNVRRLRQETR